MKKSYVALSALLVLAMLIVGARSLIMKLEMKDGTVRYIDTESLEEFNLIELDEIPQTQQSRYITEPLWEGASAFHTGFFSGRTDGVMVEETYVPYDPDPYIFTLKSWRPGCKPIQAVLREGVLSVACQTTGYLDPEYGEIWVADLDNYYSEVLGQVYHGLDIPKMLNDNLHYYGYSNDGYYGFDLSLVYFAPDYGDGKTFAKESHERVIKKDYPRVKVTADAVLADSESSYIEINLELLEQLPTKVGLTFGCIEVEDMDAYLNDNTRYDKEYELRNSVRERNDAKKFDYVVTFDDSNSATVKVPFSGSAYAEIYFSVFDTAGSEDKTVIENLSIFGNYVAHEPIDYKVVPAFFYSDLWNGTPWLVDVEWHTPKDNPKAVKALIPDMFSSGSTAEIDIDLSEKYPDGTHPARLVGMPTGVTQGDGNELYWTSLVEFFKSQGYSEEEIFGAYPEAQYGSNYNPKTGVISLVNTYTLPGKSASSWYGMQIERFGLVIENNLDHNLKIEYAGTEKTADGKTIVTAKVSSGADVKEVRVANVRTLKPETAVDELRYGECDYKTIDGAARNITVEFEVTESGIYSLAAVAFDNEGAVVNSDYALYSVSVINGDPNEGWTSLGVGTFTDGVNGSLHMQDYDPEVFTYEVEIQEKDGVPGLYRVANVFGNSPIADLNMYPDPGYFEIDCTNPDFPLAAMQFVGWADDWGYLSFGNYEAYLAETNPGVDGPTIQAFLESNGFDITTFENGVITIPNPLWSYSEQYPGLYQAEHDIVITMPSAVKESPKKVAGSKAYIGQKRQIKADDTTRSLSPAAMPRQLKR